MKMIYIASPYTVGDVAVNVRESLVAADELVTFGYLPYAPLLSHFWHFLVPHPYDYWLQIDLAMILRCDAVLRLPGLSTFADTEVLYALKNNIPVFYSFDEMRAKFGL